MTTPERVLVCDDEQQILRALRVVLRDAGFEVVPASTAAEALDEAAVGPLDAAIVDLVLPDGDGIEVCRRLREWSTMPILVLSAVGEEEQKVRALEAGADDYVTKPFGSRELVARLRAALRRAGSGAEEPVLAFDGLEIDLAARVVRRDGAAVHLTPIEFDLMRMLVRNRGRLLTHRTLLNEVWGPRYADDVQTLRTHIARLRSKIEPPMVERPRYIHTDSGVGLPLRRDVEGRFPRTSDHADRAPAARVSRAQPWTRRAARQPCAPRPRGRCVRADRASRWRSRPCLGGPSPARARRACRP